MSHGARRSGAGHPAVRTRFTDRRDGDLRVGLPADVLAVRRAAVAPVPWTWLDQVHGDRVVVVHRPGEHAGAPADAAVTAAVGATLAVHTADCAGVLLRSNGPGPTVVGAAHAGWRGLELGVLDATVSAMVDLGAEHITWRLGPCISPAEYEFGPEELARLADRFGPSVVATTRTGAAAFDLRAGVAAALHAAGAEPELAAPTEVRCTASDPDCFSWRAARDTGRQASVTWIEAA